MAKHTCTEQLAMEFKTLRVDGVPPSNAVLPSNVKRISEISDAELREWVTVEEDPANKKNKASIRFDVVNPPAWLSDPAPKEELKPVYFSMPDGNEGACAPVLLDGACSVFEEAAKRQRRFAQVIQEAFGGRDSRVAAQEIMAFAAIDVPTVAYGVAVQPEEVVAPVVTVTAVPDASAYVETEDDDINGFYGMGTSDHDAPLVEAPRWSYLDQCHHHSAPVLPPSPCFLVEEQNAVVA